MAAISDHVLIHVQEPSPPPSPSPSPSPPLVSPSLPPTPHPSPFKREEEREREDEYMYFPITSGLTYTDVISHSLTQRTIKSLCINTQSYEGEGIRVESNGQEVTIFHINNRLYCIDERCPHAGGPLHLGDIEDSVSGCGPCVTCPWHRYCFQLSSGTIVHPQSRGDLRLTTHPIKVSANGQLMIGFKSFRPSIFRDINF